MCSGTYPLAPRCAMTNGRVGGPRAFRHENCAHESRRDVTPECPAMRSFVLAASVASQSVFPRRGVAPMKTIVRCLPEAYGAQCGLSRRWALSLPDARAIRARWWWASPWSFPPLNEYCAVAQKEIASSRVPARNVLVSDYQAFSRAQPVGEAARDDAVRGVRRSAAHQGAHDFLQAAQRRANPRRIRRDGRRGIDAPARASIAARSMR